MIHGILNVYKEKGYTSHDVVAKLRGITAQKKIGHTGTLDPGAEGVLPVCLGRATKLCDMLTDKDKTYEAVLLLGRETDTQDISGRVLKEYDAGQITAAAAEKVIRSYTGEYSQIPPMYSAVRLKGRKLYELAREGKVVERKARTVHIHDIRIMDIALPRIRLEVSCSKGTYIRTLCHDIGQQLGCGGCMEELVRTRSGVFEIEDSRNLQEIQEIRETGKLEDIVIPIDAMFPDYEKATIRKGQEALAYNGNPFPREALEDGKQFEREERVRLYDKAGHFIAVYQIDESGRKFRNIKMFYDSNDG